MRFYNFYRSLSKDGKVDFADRVGTSYAYLSQLATGHRRPGWEMARAIIAASEGLVDDDPKSFGPPKNSSAKARKDTPKSKTQPTGLAPKDGQPAGGNVEQAA